MWSLNLAKIESHLPEGFGAIAVESGTCRGNGAKALAKKFKRVITIELSAELHLAAGKRFETEGLAHIEALQGNSADVLRRLLPTLPPEPIFFFLDAHWSGDQTVDWKKSEWKGYGIDTAHLASAGKRPSGSEQCPLLEELSAIVSLCRAQAVILIDDMKNIPAFGSGLRDLTFPGEDWSHLSREKILAVVAPRLGRIFDLQDPAQLLVILEKV